MPRKQDQVLNMPRMKRSYCMHGDFIINLLYHRVLLPEVTSEVSIGQDFMQQQSVLRNMPQKKQLNSAEPHAKVL